MKIEWDPDKWNRPFKVLLILCLICAFIVVPLLRDIKLRLYHRWTVGTTIGWDRGSYVKYYIEINGKRYEGSAKSLGLNSNGSKYWVQFDATDPNHNVIRTNEEVPECVIDIPANGWEEKPSCP